MVFNCLQDICSSFDITFVWSAQLLPGGCGEGERKEGKRCWVRLWLPNRATSGSKTGLHSCLSRFHLSSQPSSSATSSRKPPWVFPLSGH